MTWRISNILQIYCKHRDLFRKIISRFRDQPQMFETHRGQSSFFFNILKTRIWQFFFKQVFLGVLELINALCILMLCVIYMHLHVKKRSLDFLGLQNCTKHLMAVSNKIEFSWFYFQYFTLMPGCKLLYHFLLMICLERGWATTS